MRTTFIISVIALMIFACGQSNEGGKAGDAQEKVEKVDDGRGVGETTSVTLNDPLDPDMVSRGKAVYEMKCAACHKLKGSRVVGPSWAGLTSQRKPEWIMNMITNVEVMLDEDPTAQALLEECLTRMPNQNVSVADARDILEFMYQNDLDNPK